ncbi:COP23 domain-containing protein [Limnospira fusiformis KN01]|uniref:COP23 domain-containing protein n=1 Tax=Limnospira fusiformis PMC 851.14 TaxID=2219512 RepID=A0ABU9EQV1_LIMFS|nr:MULTISPECIES: COP23 domain-containing protein [Limnospira]MDY7053707.1 COP23 domain-containing protein [Limnospira fusiformis LS22]RAQ47041.1 hypothetical protein B9S53_05185 [Arthrospira sp. O9.13F]MDT9187154.1 COP23 domain-containing protein [Limnospira sp. PMC 894.15]MDT9197003.1 COP23 domain-containing protein [Limnospira sp. PMC 1042.18]MDT9274883.1 COP23 domain-containing protein [Limnospira sp. PMC 737.11]
MKPKYLFNLATGGAMAIASFFVGNGTAAEETEITQFPRHRHQLYQPHQRYNTVVEQEFFCGRSDDDVPTTFVRNSRGTFPVIRWVSLVFNQAGYVPQTRCRQVSAKFQEFYERGLLNYVTTGTVNRQPVICVSDAKDGPCLGVLFTLKPNQDARRTIRQLFALQANANAGPLSETDSRLYLDFQEYLDQQITFNSD